MARFAARIGMRRCPETQPTSDSFNPALSCGETHGPTAKIRNRGFWLRYGTPCSHFHQYAPAGKFPLSCWRRPSRRSVSRESRNYSSQETYSRHSRRGRAGCASAATASSRADNSARANPDIAVRASPGICHSSLPLKNSQCRGFSWSVRRCRAPAEDSSPDRNR